jgi:hypothetical protein
MSAAKELLFDQMEIDSLETAGSVGYRGHKAIVLSVAITTQQLEHLRRLGWKFVSEERLSDGQTKYQFKRGGAMS